MSEEERDLIVGRAIRSLREKTDLLGDLEMKAREMAADIGIVASVLQPVSARNHLRQGRDDIQRRRSFWVDVLNNKDNNAANVPWPSLDELTDVYIETRALRKEIEELREELRNSGFLFDGQRGAKTGIS